LLRGRDEEKQKAAEAAVSVASFVATNLMSKLGEGVDNESNNESIKENGRTPKGVTMVEDKAEPPKRRHGKRDKAPPKD